MSDEPIDMSGNIAAERLAERRDRAEQRRQEEPELPLVILSEEERGRVPIPPPVQPRRRIYPRKLKVKKPEQQKRATSVQIGKPGKTARNKAKIKDPANKTNVPTISQSMKGKSGGGGDQRKGGGGKKK